MYPRPSIEYVAALVADWSYDYEYAVLYIRSSSSLTCTSPFLYYGRRRPVGARTPEYCTRYRVAIDTI
jgi:hypothetical protein